MIEEKNIVMAPEFSATDSEGHILNLSDYRGKKNVLLVINRGFT